MKPQMLIERTTAVFETTSVIYNDPSVMYSSSLHTYGGSDRKNSPGPQNASSNINKPNMLGNDVN